MHILSTTIITCIPKYTSLLISAYTPRFEIKRKRKRKGKRKGKYNYSSHGLVKKFSFRESASAQALVVLMLFPVDKPKCKKSLVTCYLILQLRIINHL